MSDLAPDEVFCPACGVVIHESANFCPECGAENDVFRGPPQDPPPASAPQDPPPASAPQDPPPGGPQRDPPPAGAPAGPPQGGAPPAGGGRAEGGPTTYERLIDRHWPLASQQQALAGAKSGVYATILGFSATLAWTAVSALGVLTGGASVRGGDYGGVGGGAPTAGEAFNVAAALVELVQSSAMVLVKFVFWLYYSANFVPIAVDTGGRSLQVDLLSGLAPLGVSPMAYRVTVGVVLLVFGYRAAASRGYRSYAESAGAGATVAVGYLLILVPGAVLVGFSAGGQVGEALSVGPSLAMSVAFPGAFAVVCGSVGGLLREYARRS